MSVSAEAQLDVRENCHKYSAGALLRETDHWAIDGSASSSREKVDL